MTQRLALAAKNRSTHSSASIMVALEENAPASDACKIQIMKRRNEARARRLLDTKTLQIGVDTAALAQQCREKEEQRQAEAQELAAYVDYEAKLSDLVAANEALECEAKRNAMETLKTEWAQHAAANKSVAAARAQEAKAATKLELCGAGSAQVMAGEDLDYEARQVAMAKRCRDGFSLQVDGHQAQRYADVARTKHLDDYALYLAAQRAQLDQTDCERRQADLTALVAANRQDALKKTQRALATASQVANIEALETQAKRRDPTLCETTSVAISALAPHRYRPDHFKGLASEQRRDLVASNADLIRAKQQAADLERQHDADFDVALLQQTKDAQDADDIHHLEKRLANQKLQQDYLKLAEIQKQKRLQEHRDRFGYVKPGGYMDGFGCSAR